MHPQPNADLASWLGYIEQLHPTEIEMGLTRLQQVWQRMSQPATKPVVFTVAGTNGKGTTTAVLASLAQASGATVGWYTSPHLIRFNERVKINAQPVTDEQLIHAFEAVETAREEVSLSYFEFTTLAAFWVFQQQAVDVWVLEIGLGGRLDAVNIIESDVAVVTTIGLDHQGFLGDTLEAIGREKAGIARGDKPLVLGSSAIPSSVFDVAMEKGAKVFSFGEAHGVQASAAFAGDWKVEYIPDSLPIANVATALQAYRVSPLPELTQAQVEVAIGQVNLPGRMQYLQVKGRKVVLDVGHNPQAGEYLATKLGNEQWHLVLGMLADKDSRAFAEPLLAKAASVSTVTLAVPRGLTAEQLSERLGDVPAHQGSVKEVLTALLAESDDRPLFVGGSFYTVADALSVLEN